MKLSELSDPKNFHDAIDISGISRESCLSFYKNMFLIRQAEDLLAAKKRDGFIGGPVHLGAGQEAIPVGISASLSHSDYVFGAHRSHGHLLALGSCVYKLFAEILGKETGHSRGMGGSMHLWDENSGFYGSVPIMAGTVPLAVGSAFACKLKSSTSIAVAYLGDGAMEEGVVVESMNLAKIHNLPVLFVLENNLFASHMHLSLRQPSLEVSRFAKACDIPSRIIDGNDVTCVYHNAKDFIQNIRDNEGPRFLECVTYRIYGHVDWRDDVDVGVNRSMEDINDWKLRDPLKRLLDAISLCHKCSIEEVTNIEKEIEDKINKSWDLAMSDPYPSQDKLLSRVYS